MKNIYSMDEPVTKNDLYFLCYMIERLGRRLHQRNRYIVNSIDKDQWLHLICIASVLHCENPLQVEDDWIEDYHLASGSFDILDVDRQLVTHIPTPTQMGKVYKRLIIDTIQTEETYVDALIRVYNDTICDILDDYSTGAFYEPSYCITRAYLNGGF